MTHHLLSGRRHPHTLAPLDTAHRSPEPSPPRRTHLARITLPLFYSMNPLWCVSLLLLSLGGVTEQAFTDAEYQQAVQYTDKGKWLVLFGYFCLLA